MARLPQPGQDVGTWGSVLNEYLSVAHNADGSLRAFANPVDYGAKGDGTTDDTAAINAALASTDSKVIFLPAGTYIISARINLTKSLICTPGATIKKVNNFNGTEAILVTTANITIDGLTLDGNRTENAVGAGITWNSANGKMINCTVKRVKGVGINVSGATADLVCTNCESSENVGGAGFGANGDGFFVSSGGKLRTYNCRANENDRAGFLFLNGAADGCHLDGTANGNAFGAMIYSNMGTCGRFSGDKNNRFGIVVGKDGGTLVVSYWQFNTLEFRNIGVSFIRSDGFTVPQNDAATAVELYGATFNNFGTILSHNALGYALAIANSASGGSNDNHFGTVLSHGTADPGIVFAGSPTRNVIGTAIINKSTVAVSFGEASGTPTYNTIGTLIAESCQYGVLIMTAGQNNRIDRIISRDNYNISTTIPALLYFNGPAVANNRIGYFEHATISNPTPKAVLTRANGATNNVVEASKDGAVVKTKAGIPTDADFQVPPVDGTLCIDTTNKRVYVRIGGLWKSVLVA